MQAGLPAPTPVSMACDSHPVVPTPPKPSVGPHSAHSVTLWQILNCPPVPPNENSGLRGRRIMISAGISLLNPRQAGRIHHPWCQPTSDRADLAAAALSLVVSCLCFFFTIFCDYKSSIFSILKNYITLQNLCIWNHHVVYLKRARCYISVIPQ